MYNFKFKKALRSDFARDENGSSSIETIIMVPMIFFVVLSIFTLYDAPESGLYAWRHDLS